MDNNNVRKYSFIAQVLILFAVDVMILMIITSLTGDDAKQISSMFRLGSHGLAISTLLQFLFNSLLVISLKSFIFSGRFFKNLLTLWRTVLLLFSILAVTVVFIILFHWFPLDNLFAWIGFLICFGGCFIISSSFLIIKTRLENKRYNELLSNYKDQHRGENDNE